jgi:hypothetical protein
MLVSDRPSKPGKTQVEVVADGKAAARGRRTSPDAAFDLWLQRGLHTLFDDVAKEPIPAELLALIDKDRSKG